LNLKEYSVGHVNDLAYTAGLTTNKNSSNLEMVICQASLVDITNAISLAPKLVRQSAFTFEESKYKFTDGPTTRRAVEISQAEGPSR